MVITAQMVSYSQHANDLSAMKVSIVYDGECPICRNVVRASRLRDRTAELELVNARRDRVDDIQGRNLRDLDFDQGFAVVIDGEIHHGADGARMLSALTRPNGAVYGLFRWLMANESRSRAWYPVLRAGRNLLLRVLRVPKFNDT